MKAKPSPVAEGSKEASIQGTHVLAPQGRAAPSQKEHLQAASKVWGLTRALDTAALHHCP